MKISRFKIFNYASATIIVLFSIYAQYQEIMKSIYAGVPNNLIIKSVIFIYMLFYIASFLLLIEYKRANSQEQSFKHVIMSALKSSILLSVILTGTLIIALEKNRLWTFYILSLLVILIVRINLKYICKPHEDQ